jgi:hypothetical protein
MAVETLSTEGAGSGNRPLTVPSRPKRRRRLVLLALTLLAALLIGSIAYVSNYMPMSPANGTGGGLNRHDLGSFLSPLGEGFDATEYTYERGGRFWFGFGLRNDGPLGVTIRGIDSGLPDSSDFEGLARQSGVWIATGSSWYGPPRGRGSETFHPFWLGPGQERWVFIEIQFRDCAPVGAEGGTLTQYLRGAYLTYRVLGLPRHGFMPYNNVMHLTGPSLDPNC